MKALTGITPIEGKFCFSSGPVQESGSSSK